MDLVKSSDQEIAPFEEATEDDTSAPRSVVARFGTFYIETPEGSTSVEDFVRQLAGEIDKDPRVISIKLPPFDSRRDSFKGFYPAPEDESQGSREKLLRGSDLERTFDLAGAIQIRVRAPIKNQRTFSSEDVPPAEEYSAMWDGISLIVFWEQDPDERVPRSGGHVLEDILSLAAKNIGAALYVQGCNPGCTYSFIHTSLRVNRVDDAGEGFQPTKDSEQTLVYNFDVDKGLSFYEICEDVYSQLISVLWIFAEMKNVERRLIDLEDLTREAFDDLLSEQYLRAQVREDPFLKSFRHRRATWGWRGRSRHLLARIWLCISSIEILKRRWTAARLEFDRRAEDRNALALFERDYTHEAKEIEQLDLSDIQNAVISISQSLDNRAIVFATAGGALAGALAGAIASGLLS